MKEFPRSLRVAQSIKKEIAAILQHKIKNPNINMITTISDVIVSHDLSYAKIFVTFLKKRENINQEDKETINMNIEALKHSSGFIRFLLGKAVRLRILPELVFVYDNSIIEGRRIFNLVKTIKDKS